MAKRRRREQQHLAQRSTRRKAYGSSASGQPDVKYRPPFPFNILQNAKIFYISGAAIMVGGVVIAAVAGGRGANPGNPVDIPTLSPSATPDGTTTPGETPTPNPRNFPRAEAVIDPDAYTYTATINTAKGEIVIELFADEAPNTVNSFVFLAQNNFFDGLVFHRVEPNFVAQGGDPLGTGFGGPGYETQVEDNDIPNDRGRISMARAGGSTTFGSQFFINLKDNPGLDAPGSKYPPFGEVIEGMDVVDQLEVGDVMISVTITATLKPGVTPTAVPTSTPEGGDATATPTE